ncbi:MAG: glycosyltransferase family 4 protein [Pseudomonadota bacterium]|nr:glycosyltransferase family 4 protein [Pseudomonadota bacterium]
MYRAPRRLRGGGASDGDMNIYLDITRLATRIFRSGPTGIDRVEYAYAKHMIDDPRVTCVFNAPVFFGVVRANRAKDILQRVEAAWRLDAGAPSDGVYVALREWLDRPFDAAAAKPVRFRSPKRWPSWWRDLDSFPPRDILRAETRLARRLRRHGDQPAMFFHCSHAQLDKPERFRWLKNGGVRSTFFLHDAIPVEFPEFCSPGALDRHVARLATVSDYASLAIVNSQDSRRAVATALGDRGLRAPEIEIVPLAVDEAFSAARRTPPRRPAIPYFLYVGTIEPRKNLLFLLAVWRRLVERHGAATPRLVIAGRRGWENENIVDVLERSRQLAPFLAEASDLTDAGLARLMADSAALVAPSFTEGFGLPVVECLAAGAPAIISDISAHREVGAGYAMFADAIDGPAWVAAVEALADEASEFRREALARIAGYQPLTWAAHVERARALMERAGAAA